MYIPFKCIHILQYLPSSIYISVCVYNIWNTIIYNGTNQDLANTESEYIYRCMYVQMLLILFMNVVR